MKSLIALSLMLSSAVYADEKPTTTEVELQAVSAERAQAKKLTRLEIALEKFKSHRTNSRKKS